MTKLSDNISAHFFLGGRDLEMQTIRDLLTDELGPNSYTDKQLPWGAKASDYADEIHSCVQSGITPVLIELNIDTKIPDTTIVIDHHSEKAGRDQPTALEQVFSLLNLDQQKWTRHFDLVAANDRGHIQAMRAIGASDKEIMEIRTQDREAQGITPEQDTQGDEATKQARYIHEGKILWADLPHNRTATVMDRLCTQPNPPTVTMITCPEEVNIYAPGPVIQLMAQEFPSCWYGGDLPSSGYWGHETKSLAEQKRICETLLSIIK